MIIITDSVKDKLKPESGLVNSGNWQETCPASVWKKIQPCWLNTNEVSQTSKKLFPPLLNRILNLKARGE